MNNQYHILSLSGGKDSTALAFFIKENMPDIHEKIEYVFCDTECEIPETYDYLNKIEIFLDKKITRLKPYKSFEHLIQLQNFLPTPHRRWCTVMLKTVPFKKFVHGLVSKQENSIVNLYIGIRHDESNRAQVGQYGINTIQECYPFVEHCINKQDIFKILEKNGIGLPDYYKWTSRSGCYFCFFKSKLSWILLNEHHPDLYKKAIKLEQPRINEGGFGWNIDYTLAELIKPKTTKIIKEKYKLIFKKRASEENVTQNLLELIEGVDNNETGSCYMCHL